MFWQNPGTPDPTEFLGFEYYIYVEKRTREGWLGFLFWDGAWRIASVEDVSFEQAELTADDALVAIGTPFAAQQVARGYRLTVKRFPKHEDHPDYGQGKEIWSSGPY